MTRQRPTAPKNPPGHEPGVPDVVRRSGTLRRRWITSMSYTRRATSLAAVGAVAALALAACGGSGSNGPTASSSSGGSGFNAAITSVVNPSTKARGTLKLSATGDCDAWDGANMYYAFCWDLSRLYMRNLMGYQSKPGPTVAVPTSRRRPASTTPTSRRGRTTSRTA